MCVRAAAMPFAFFASHAHTYLPVRSNSPKTCPASSSLPIISFSCNRTNASPFPLSVGGRQPYVRQPQHFAPQQQQQQQQPIYGGEYQVTFKYYSCP